MTSVIASSDRAALFVGRVAELERLNTALAETAAGSGRVVMLAGEAGIGKTRTAAEFAGRARASGAQVLRGACYEGEWAPPYGPFAEALTSYVRASDASVLREELGFGAAPLARIVPAIRERVPDVPEPVALQPDEERFRLFDAVSQFFIAIANTRKVLLLLDDLHWADRGTIALLRHVARFAPAHRLMVCGTYRNDEIDSTHPLDEVLGVLRRESTYERVLLNGLDAEETEELVTAVAQYGLAGAVLRDIHRNTQGNPFFIRETVQHLIEEGRLANEQSTLPEMTVPDGIRHVVARRLARLSGNANRLLTVAATFCGPFRHDIAAAVAGLDSNAALDAVDEALRAQLITSTGEADVYDFGHALIRHTVYTALSPSRRVRLHRQLAEAMEASLASCLDEHAAEIAQQFHRSKDLPGAHPGATHAGVAAAQAEAAAAWDEVATFLRMALDLMNLGDTRRPRIVARLGQALAFIPEPNSVLDTIEEAVRGLDATEGADAATEYMSIMMERLYDVGLFEQAFAIANLGLKRVGPARDARWARFAALDALGRESNESRELSTPLETPERWEIGRLFGSDPSQRPGYAWAYIPYADRNDALERNAHVYLTGEYRSAARANTAKAKEWEREGRIGRAVAAWSTAGRCHTALGELTQARSTLDHALDLARRLAFPSLHGVQLIGAEDEWRMAVDRGWGDPMPNVGSPVGNAGGSRRYNASTEAAIARTLGRLGFVGPAMDRLTALIPVLQQAPAWSENFVRIACDAAETLWLTSRTDHIETVERSLREKVVAPDFRYPMMDGRLALGRLCALQHRHDEAVEWFAKARTLLDEQGARPLRAIVDYDEALMYARHGAKGDLERAVPLVEAALAQFRAIGMPGWVRRAEHLQGTGTEWVPAADAATQSGSRNVRPEAAQREPGTPTPEPATCVFRCEGDVWAITFAGATHRIKDSRGLRYLALLFAHPGRELHASEIVSLSVAPPTQAQTVDTEQTDAGDLGDAGTILDASAAAQYKQRLDVAREELREAEANNDLGRIERLRHELELLVGSLTAARRGRRAASHAERARSAVSKRIRAALKQIGAVDPTLGRCLNLSIRTGIFCSYRPAPSPQIDVRLP